jgi:hypothetical protein
MHSSDAETGYPKWYIYAGGKCWTAFSLNFVYPCNQLGYLEFCFETYSNARVNKHLTDTFRFENGLKEGHALSLYLLKFVSKYAQ